MFLRVQLPKEEISKQTVLFLEQRQQFSLSRHFLCLLMGVLYKGSATLDLMTLVFGCTFACFDRVPKTWKLEFNKSGITIDLKVLLLAIAPISYIFTLSNIQAGRRRTVLLMSGIEEMECVVDAGNWDCELNHCLSSRVMVAYTVQDPRSNMRISPEVDIDAAKESSLTRQRYPFRLALSPKPGWILILCIMIPSSNPAPLWLSPVDPPFLPRSQIQFLPHPSRTLQTCANRRGCDSRRFGSPRPQP